MCYSGKANKHTHRDMQTVIMIMSALIPTQKHTLHFSMVITLSSGVSHLIITIKNGVEEIALTSFLLQLWLAAILSKSKQNMKKREHHLIILVNAINRVHITLAKIMASNF
jgi:hypothetical protein